MPPYGNSFYCCISYFKYKNQENYNIIMNLIFKYISKNPEKFCIYFEGNDIDNLKNYHHKFYYEIILVSTIKMENLLEIWNTGQYVKYLI